MPLPTKTRTSTPYNMQLCCQQRCKTPTVVKSRPTTVMLYVCVLATTVDWAATSCVWWQQLGLLLSEAISLRTDNTLDLSLQSSSCGIRLNPTAATKFVRCAATSCSWPRRTTAAHGLETVLLLGYSSGSWGCCRWADLPTWPCLTGSLLAPSIWSAGDVFLRPPRSRLLNARAWRSVSLSCAAERCRNVVCQVIQRYC